MKSKISVFIPVRLKSKRLKYKALKKLEKNLVSIDVLIML